MTGDVRVRFAPSPTGEPHIGNIRTAVFAWLFAKGSNGTFAVRIEDTDQTRFVEGAVDSILESLRWLGLDWDEGPDIGGSYGPYYQSDRKERGDYRIAANRLLASGHAYYCVCSPQRLAQVRESQRAAGAPPGYDRRCRGNSQETVNSSSEEGPAPVVRFASPRSGTTTVTDIVRGEVSFENDVMDDFVLLKSDGFPTYHLANVVDDHAMKISHVIRAEEWLPSLPRHWRLYEAFGFPKPQFAHVPMILAKDRSKLSKRHGATSISEFRRAGYLPDAMINFLSLLGWSLDDKTEILSRSELKRHFSLERVSRSPAIFNSEKLDWMNGQYIQRSEPDELAADILAHWSEFPPDDLNTMPEPGELAKVMPLVRERMRSLSEAAGMVGFLYTDQLRYSEDDLVPKKMDLATALISLSRCLEELEAVDNFDAPCIEARLRELAAGMDMKLGPLLGPLRIAVTGRRVSPPLFESMELLGRARTTRRTAEAIERLRRAAG